MPKRFALAIFLLVGMLVGARTYFRWVSPDTAFFTLAALQLVGIIVVLVGVFIVASWATVIVFGWAFRDRLMRSYPLFLGWNLLRSHRRVIRFSHRLATWTESVAPLGKSLVPRITIAVGVAGLALASAWWCSEHTDPRGIGGIALQELVVFGLFGTAIGAGLFTVVHLLTAVGVLPRTKLDVDSDLVPMAGRNAITLPNFISMVGVGIGVWAMILVLAVISGFEANLRSKILQTNAHVVIQPAGQHDEITDIRKRIRTLSGIAGVASADPYIQNEAMVSSPFNSSVNLTVRGIDPYGTTATRLAENLIAGGIEFLDRPELLGSDRALEWALPPGFVDENPTTTPDPALPKPQLENVDENNDEDEIVMPPIPGGTPTAKNVDTIDDMIEMPAIPGGAPQGTAEALPEAVPGVLLEQDVATTIKVRRGDLVDVVYSPAPAKGEPENESHILRLQVVGIYRRSPDDPDRPDGYVLPEVRRHLGATRDRALVILSGPGGDDKPGFLGAVSADSPDVAALTGSLVVGTLQSLFDRGFPTNDAFNKDTRGIDRIRSGYPPPDNAYPAIIIGSELANSLRVGVGNEVRLISLDSGVGPGGVMPKAATFLVAGVFRTGMYEFDLKLAYITVPDAQRFFELGNTLNRIELRLDRPENPELIRAEVQTAVGDLAEVLDWQMMNRSLFSALKLEKIVMFLILACIILVASFNIVSSLAMLIQQKSKEIAILKSMGATDRGILGTFVMLGLFLGIFGAMSGTLLGLVTCFVLDQVGIALPREYYVSTIPVKINPFEVAVTASAALLVSMIATILPSLVASRLRPVEGLRYE